MPSPRHTRPAKSRLHPYTAALATFATLSLCSAASPAAAQVVLVETEDPAFVNRDIGTSLNDTSSVNGKPHFPSCGNAVALLRRTRAVASGDYSRSSRLSAGSSPTSWSTSLASPSAVSAVVAVCNIGRSTDVPGPVVDSTSTSSKA